MPLGQPRTRPEPHLVSAAIALTAGRDGPSQSAASRSASRSITRCRICGYVGGPIFPSLFIGGTAGVLVHQVIPGVPLGLAFTCLLAAVPGALAPAPFSMVLMAAFLTQVGALQTAPILIAVVTAFLTMEGVKYVLASRKQARTAAAKPAAPA